MRRPFLLLPLLALAAVLVAGCGSGGALSLDPVAAAASKTADEQTFKVEYSMDMTVQGQKLSFGGNGAFDGARKVAQMSVDLSQLQLPLPSAGDKSATIVFADSVMYMQMPFLASMLPSGKPWVKFDLRKVAKTAGVDLGSFDGIDPKQSLDQLLASGDAKKVGTDTIKGAQTTHYRAVLDLSKATQIPAAQRKKLERLLKGMNVTAPVDVWVDGDGRVRRERVTFDSGSGLTSVQATMVMDFVDFGTPVDVTVPAADEVSDFSTLFGQYQKTPTS